MKSDNMVETINIEVNLVKSEENKNGLSFSLPQGEVFISLESNDTNCIKKVFSEMVGILCRNKVSLDFRVDNSSIDENKEKLFIDASREYIEKLSGELAEMEEDEDVKNFRKEYLEISSEEG